MSTEDQKSYGICIELYGECRCLLASRSPCEAMICLAEDGSGADDERERMAAERDDAADGQ